MRRSVEERQGTKIRGKIVRESSRSQLGAEPRQPLERETRGERQKKETASQWVDYHFPKIRGVAPLKKKGKNHSALRVRKTAPAQRSSNETAKTKLENFQRTPPRQSLGPAVSR